MICHAINREIANRGHCQLRSIENKLQKYKLHNYFRFAHLCRF